MYVPIEINYWEDAWKEWGDSDEKYAELRTILPRLPAKRASYGAPEFWATLKDMTTLQELGIPFKLNESELGSSTGTMIVKMQEKLEEKFPGRQNYDVEKPEAMAAGACAQITIPDLGLLVIDEVTYLTDSCTDVLQEHLEDGWRILAVCPPNAQRRPDYILGRKAR